MGWPLDAFFRNVVILSNRRNRACSGSSAGGAGSPGSRSRTSETTWAMSAPPGPRGGAPEPAPQLVHLLPPPDECPARQPVQRVRLLLYDPLSDRRGRIH